MGYSPSPSPWPPIIAVVGDVLDTLVFEVSDPVLGAEDATAENGKSTNDHDAETKLLGRSRLDIITARPKTMRVTMAPITTAATAETVRNTRSPQMAIVPNSSMPNIGTSIRSKETRSDHRNMASGSPEARSDQAVISHSMAMTTRMMRPRPGRLCSWPSQ